MRRAFFISVTTPLIFKLTVAEENDISRESLRNLCVFDYELSAN